MKDILGWGSSVSKNRDMQMCVYPMDISVETKSDIKREKGIQALKQQGWKLGTKRKHGKFEELKEIKRSRIRQF